MKVKNLAVWLLCLILLTLILAPTTFGDEYAKLREGGHIRIYPGYSPYTSFFYKIKGGSEVEILERGKIDYEDCNEDCWVKIKVTEKQLVNTESWLISKEDGEAWIPEWYIVKEDSKPIEKVSGDCGPFVLNRDNPAYLYPGGPEIGELLDIDYFNTYEKGKLLRPKYKWEDWYLVDIIVYEVPNVNEAWFPSEVLSSLKEVDPIEGYITEGTVIYYNFEDIEKGKEQKASLPSFTQVYLHEEKDGYVYLIGPAGWSAWTKKENIVYDRDKIEKKQ